MFLLPPPALSILPDLQSLCSSQGEGGREGKTGALPWAPTPPGDAPGKQVQGLWFQRQNCLMLS